MPGTCKQKHWQWGSLSQQSTFSYASTSPTSTGSSVPTSQYYSYSSTPLSSMPGSVTPPSSNVLVDATNRFSADSTTSASSSGNWSSNRESLDQMHSQPLKPNYYHPAGSNANLSPPPPPPPQPMNGSIPYGIPEDRPFPAAPPDIYQQPGHHGYYPQSSSPARNSSEMSGHQYPDGSLVGSPSRGMSGSPHHNIPSPNNEPVYHQPMSPQHPMSPRRLQQDLSHQLENGVWMKRGGSGKVYLDNSGEESGIDVSSSTESMEKRNYGGGILTPGNAPNIHMNVNSKPLGHSQPFHSFENVLGDKDTFRALAGHQRPHSDGATDVKMDMMRQSEIQPHYPGKDVDRIYEWLRRQRMPEYTNNFTKAGYDMPTIARMTPEDLTAIGVTKPGHRKRISAMIGQMSEPDGIPNYKPHDVVTWLKLLDLFQYHNTFMSNNYNTMEAVSEITWEDLQEIGINQLGHQKKFSLAIKRLRDLQKQASRVMASAQQAGSTGSDDSTSPHSSNDGVYHHHHHHHQHHSHHPNTLMLNTLEQQTSPLQSPENTLIKKKSGLRSSQESLGSNGSNKSSGSHGSHEQGYPKKIVHLRQLSESREASYVPTVTNLKVAPGKQPEHRQASPEGETATLPSNYQPFSTFKQQPVSTPGGTFKIPAVPREKKSSESLERVLAAQGNNGDSASSTPKRNSVEGGSSIASSGSGDGSVKMKRAKPPAPPKRTNSVRTMDEEQLKTATIGRKKSLKQFREEMAAGNMSKKVELPEGFATIKRSSSRKAPILNRSSSQDGDNPPGGLSANFGPPLAPTVPQVQSVVSNASNQQSYSSFGVNKPDEELQPQATVSYNAYGLSNQPVAPVQQQPLQQQPNSVSGNGTPSRSVSVPTSPVNMPQNPSWTNQDTQGSREPVPSTPSVSSPPPTTQKPTVTKPNAALIAEMQKSIALSMLTGPPANSQSTLETTFHSSASASVVTNSTVQSTTATNQLANTNIPYNVASSQRQPEEEQSVFLNEMSENHRRSSGGTLKLSQTLPRSSNRPPSVELLQNTTRRLSSGGFKLGIDVAQEKQIHNRVAQSDVPMREGFHNNSHRPPSTGSTGSGGSGSTDSSSNKPDRAGNMELLWRRMSQETDESAPIIQPVLSKPLEGIWRPKSRHFENGIPGQTEDQNQVDCNQEVEVSGQKLQTKATFRSLKKQFLDQNATPITYHTLKRPPKKPDPNFFEEDFRPRSKSFTDMDEYHQSPVAKNAPVDFDTIMAEMADQNAQPQPEADVENNQPTSEPCPVSNGSPQKLRTQSSPVRTPVPNVGGNHKKPISLPGLVSTHGAQDANEASNNTVTSSGYKEQGPKAPSPKVAPKQVPPPQVPPPKVPKPQSQPPQVPLPPPQVPQLQAPSTEVAPLKDSSQKTSPQQMLPPKVSPKVPRVKAPSQISNPTRLEMMPPPPSIEDLPPPPNEDFPLPPPPCQDYDLPPPPDEMGLPPPPPPSMQTAAPSFTPLSYNNLPPPPPPVQQVPQQQSRQAVAPQTAPKSKPGSSRKKTRTPVVSEGWESNSDTIKRKPSPLTPVSPDKTPESISQISQPQPNENKLNPRVSKAPVKVPEKSVKTPSRTGKSPVKAPAKKKALVAPPPLDGADDVDFYSQDLDMMDTLGGQEDLVESDSSDTMESGLTGFENENTDTIKKQPGKLSPAKYSEDLNDPEIVGRTLSMENAAADQEADFIRRRKDNTSAAMKKDRDSQGFGEVSLQLADILNSMGSDDPLANFAANAEASAKARLSPSKPTPPSSYTAPSISQESAEPKDIFNDIESMFNDLTFDLENMMN
ncbi:uncharacterized protein [Asterias amurensis]|uniref:uncharacterized protein isoform X3 n=1 Tax=Asterias amurensis TaxID=7602 RepID=UPI003AB8CB2B